VAHSKPKLLAFIFEFWLALAICHHLKKAEYVFHFFDHKQLHLPK
jgi:hypothetical protein